jgi:hypothetical protein
MDINQRKEKFGEAYLRAVAAVAGFTLYRPEVDDDSVDWGLAREARKSCARTGSISPWACATTSNSGTRSCSCPACCSSSAFPPTLGNG